MHPLMGKQVVDQITGFKGVVTGFCHYISGCNQALVVPRAKPDGEMIEGIEPITLENGASPGPDKPAPKR